MKLPIPLLGFLLICTVANADQPKKIAIIKEVLVIADSRGTLEGLRVQNVAQTRNLLFSQAGEKATNPLMKRLLDRAMMKYEAYSREIFSWDRWEKEYVALYDEVYTEAEIEGVLAFYKTDAGRASLRAIPLIAARTQQRMFAQTSDREARVDQIMKETVAEIQEEVRQEGTKP